MGAGQPAPNLNMIYEFACDECRIVNEVSRPISMASEGAACPVCNEPMRRIIHAPALLNRQKPGTAASKLDRQRMQADGTANAYAYYRHHEQIGGDHWKKIKSETLTSELKGMQAYKKANQL